MMLTNYLSVLQNECIAKISGTAERLTLIDTEAKNDNWEIVTEKQKKQLEIFCGLARYFSFRPISELGDAAVKTYLSEKKAYAAFNASWRDPFDPEIHEIVPVGESIVSLPELSK